MTTLSDNIQYFVTAAHNASFNAGWWKDNEFGDLGDETVCTKLLLIVSEITEAMEGLRKNLADDKLPHHKMLHVELADALIRIGDLAGRLQIPLGTIVQEKMDYNARRADHKPENRQLVGGKKF